jgi:diaminopimelate epimerase
MRGIRFVKAVACGNDFLIIESRSAPSDVYKFSRGICDRHNAVGADGVEWIGPGSKDHDVAARLINADGSEAEISGNGTRCVAAWFARAQRQDRVRVLTGAGIKECRILHVSDPEFAFEMAMGTPQIGQEISITGTTGVPISLGNPHLVVFVEDFAFEWQAKGLAIQQSGVFPQGTNVEFVRVLTESRIEARFFERGAGETQSSGTGSCASAVAAIHRGLAKSPVTVVALGGEQIVRWETEILLEGPATIVCEGEFFWRE